MKSGQKNLIDIMYTYEPAFSSGLCAFNYTELAYVSLASITLDYLAYDISLLLNRLWCLIFICSHSYIYC